MKKREVLKYVLVVALVAALLLSTYLGININNSLQACLEKNRRASAYLASDFHTSVVRATSITYLLVTYREGLRETEPNVDNIEALIGGFFHEMDYVYLGFLRRLMTLNPELSEYEKPLYLIDKFIVYTIIGWESYTAGPTVRSVLYHLLAEASSLANYSMPLTAFKELNYTPFQKINEWSHEVAESFAPFNATRLNNTVNMVEELQGILSQWIDKYSDYEINSSNHLPNQLPSEEGGNEKRKNVWVAE